MTHIVASHSCLLQASSANSSRAPKHGWSFTSRCSHAAGTSNRVALVVDCSKHGDASAEALPCPAMLVLTSLRMVSGVTASMQPFAEANAATRLRKIAWHVGTQRPRTCASHFMPSGSVRTSGQPITAIWPPLPQLRDPAGTLSYQDDCVRNACCEQRKKTGGLAAPHHNSSCCSLLLWPAHARGIHWCRTVTATTPTGNKQRMITHLWQNPCLQYAAGANWKEGRASNAMQTGCGSRWLGASKGSGPTWRLAP
jgi:hypothetical protein